MRIAYGVQGEGMGHATRSDCVIEHLRSNDDTVEVFTSRRAYEFLSRKHPNVHHIKGFELTYKDDELLTTTSTIDIIRKLPKGLIPTLRFVLERFLETKPEAVITDHETFTALIGRLLSIPVIYAGNIAVLERTSIDEGVLAKRYPKLIVRATSRLSSFKATNYVIPTFFYPETKSSNVILTDPVVRKSYTSLEPRRGSYLFVYHTTSTNESLIRALKETGIECHIYGFGARERDGNLVFNDFDEERFTQDLAGSQAAILGGGFTTISEALYLKKPIYCVPLKNHFEQLVNANELEKRTFGEWHKEPDAKSIFDFILKAPLYEHYLEHYDMDPRSFERTVREITLIKKQEPNFTAVERIFGVIGR